MKDFIQVCYDNDNITVSARELHDLMTGSPVCANTVFPKGRTIAHF